MKLALAIMAVLLLGAGTTPEEHLQEVEKWFAGRLERLDSPTGWLSLVGLMRLPDGTHTIGSGEDAQLRLPDSVPAEVGTIVVEDGKARLEGAAGIVTVNGEAVGDLLELQSDKSDKGEGTTICEIGSVQFMVIERPGGPLLRVRDANAPMFEKFDKNIERWPVSQNWQIHAQWVEYEPPKTIKVPNQLGFIEDVSLEGYLRFEIDGEEHTLQPLPSGDELFIIFADETSGVESYGAGRYIYSDLPDEDGVVIVDFNKAYNMPCVWTPFATCSLPPEGNRLPIEVTAGEKIWGDGLH